MKKSKESSGICYNTGEPDRGGGWWGGDMLSQRGKLQKHQVFCNEMDVKYSENQIHKVINLITKRLEAYVEGDIHSHLINTE